MPREGFDQSHCGKIDRTLSTMGSCLPSLILFHIDPLSKRTDVMELQ